MNADQFLEYALPFLKKMFPHFKKSLIFRYHLWKARWSQPVVEKNYSSLIPMSDSNSRHAYLFNGSNLP